MIHYDQLLLKYTFVRSIVNVLPLTFNSTPIGFATVFLNSNEIVLFNTTFSLCRHFQTQLPGLPFIRQNSNTLFAWNKNILYVYELRESIDKVVLLGHFQVSKNNYSNPLNPRFSENKQHFYDITKGAINKAKNDFEEEIIIRDVTCTSEPSLIYVACSDSTIHIYLLKSVLFSLNLLGCKLSNSEHQIAKKLFKTAEGTKSRLQFAEMVVKKISLPPVHIDALSVTKSLSILICIFARGSISSLWVFNDSQPTKCIDFDRFEFWEPLQSSHPRSLSEFHSSPLLQNSDLNDFLKRLKLFKEFDEITDLAMIKNTFRKNTNEKPFILHEAAAPIKVRSFFCHFVIGWFWLAVTLYPLHSVI